MDLDQRTNLVKRIAREVGFDRVGVAPVDPPPHADFLQPWLDRGYGGRMKYLRRHTELRRSPGRLLPGARSVICVALNYHQPDAAASAHSSSQPRARIARYAWGRDYHLVIRKRLDGMIQRLRETLDTPFEARPFVDTAPVLERPLAAAAGLGWIGKNTLLIVPRMGSFVFLGGVMTTLPLRCERPLPDRCGRCRRCLDACPTKALTEPHVMDARRCISYLTIELRGDVPREFRTPIGDRVFGCDVCQVVCPHNRRAPATRDASLAIRDPAPRPSLTEILTWSRDAYLEATRGRALRRAKLHMFRRNAAIALGNVGGSEHVGLLKSLDGEDPLLTEHAHWAIARIEGKSQSREPNEANTH